MAIPKRLDRSRGDVGQFFPPLQHPSGCSAHYEQDGFHFDHEGNLLAAYLTDEQKAEMEKQDKGKAATTTTPQAKKPAAATRKEKREAAPKPQEQGSDQLNLEAFLRGEEKYPEFRVKKVVRDRYNRRYPTWPVNCAYRE